MPDKLFWSPKGTRKITDRKKSLMLCESMSWIEFSTENRADRHKLTNLWVLTFQIKTHLAVTSHWHYSYWVIAALLRIDQNFNCPDEICSFTLRGLGLQGEKNIKTSQIIVHFPCSHKFWSPPRAYFKTTTILYIYKCCYRCIYNIRKILVHFWQY